MDPLPRQHDPCSVLLLDEPGHDLKAMAGALRQLGHEAATMERANGLAMIRRIACDAIVIALGCEQDAAALEELRRSLPEPRYLALVASPAAAIGALRIRAPYLPLNAGAVDVSRALGIIEPRRVRSLADAEWHTIQTVLADSGGNISEAARRLAIRRTSLQRKLRKHPPVP